MQGLANDQRGCPPCNCGVVTVTSTQILSDRCLLPDINLRYESACIKLPRWHSRLSISLTYKAIRPLFWNHCRSINSSLSILSCFNNQNATLVTVSISIRLTHQMFCLSLLLVDLWTHFSHRHARFSLSKPKKSECLSFYFSGTEAIFVGANTPMLLILYVRIQSWTICHRAFYSR